MVFMKIYAKTHSARDSILDWMIERLHKNGDFSLRDLLSQHMEDLEIEDNDVLSYYDVGWNQLDMLKLYTAKLDETSSAIPEPKCRFWKHYT